MKCPIQHAHCGTVYLRRAVSNIAEVSGPLAAPLRAFGHDRLCQTRCHAGGGGGRGPASHHWPKVKKTAFSDPLTSGLEETLVPATLTLLGRALKFLNPKDFNRRWGGEYLAERLHPAARVIMRTRPAVSEFIKLVE
jgi:hypothetical protein